VGEHGYELRHESLNPDHVSGRFVVESATGRLLGGVGHNPHRAWVHPLNTPRGVGTVQEYPFDHPFHNGVFVGQSKIRVDGREAHFWAPAPDWRNPENYIYRDIGQLRYGYDQPAAIAPRGGGFRFTYRTTWRDADGQPLLDETRTIDLYAGEDGTVCDVVSAKEAAYGAVEYAATKHGAIGARVQPQLLPFMGGEILAGRGGEIERGRADDVVGGRSCDFVAYQADVPELGRFGVCLLVLANSASPERGGPWFVRDYGMAMFNPTMREPVRTATGETWLTGLRLVAYDGALTSERAERWRAMPSAPAPGR